MDYWRLDCKIWRNKCHQTQNSAAGTDQIPDDMAREIKHEMGTPFTNVIADHAY